MLMDDAIKILDDEAAFTRHALIKALRELAQHATHVADRLDANSRYMVNDLGEIQRSGPECDRLCAVLRHKERTRGMLKALIERERREAGMSG